MTRLQTILVPKRIFTKRKAIAWLKKHGYKHNKIRETTNFYRFRQSKADKNGLYSTFILPNFIEMVYIK